jgi:hypothetical protein
VTTLSRTNDRGKYFVNIHDYLYDEAVDRYRLIGKGKEGIEMINNNNKWTIAMNVLGFIFNQDEHERS